MRPAAPEGRTRVDVRAGLREIVRSARAQRVPTGLVALLVVAMCATTLLTVGRSAAAEQQVQNRLEEAGSRRLDVTDVAGEGLLTAGVVSAAATFDTVQTAIGVGTPVDVTSHGLSEPVTTAWPLLGPLDGVVRLTAGRWPEPGEALISAAARDLLSMDGPVGVITTRTGHQYPVVGEYLSTGAVAQIERGVVLAADTGPVRTLAVIVSSAEVAEVTEQAVLRLIDAPQPSALSVESPVTLAQVQSEVRGDVGRYGRELFLLVFLGGAFLVAVVVMADVLVRRTDLGRRRALGATRAFVVALVVGRTLLAAVGGAVIGTAIALGLLLRAGYFPGAGFVAGTAILALLTAGAAAAPPAVVASRQDPLKVLRTP